MAATSNRVLLSIMTLKVPLFGRAPRLVPFKVAGIPVDLRPVFFNIKVLRQGLPVVRAWVQGALALSYHIMIQD